MHLWRNHSRGARRTAPPKTLTNTIHFILSKTLAELGSLMGFIPCAPGFALDPLKGPRQPSDSTVRPHSVISEFAIVRVYHIKPSMGHDGLAFLLDKETIKSDLF